VIFKTGGPPVSCVVGAFSPLSTKPCAPRVGCQVPGRYCLMLASNLLLSAAAGSNLPSKRSPGIIPRRHLRPCCWSVSQRGALHRGRRNIGPSCRKLYRDTIYVDARDRKIRKQTLQDIFVKTNPLCIPSSRTCKIESACICNQHSYVSGQLRKATPRMNGTEART
jgi:hypothetical protein